MCSLCEGGERKCASNIHWCFLFRFVKVFFSHFFLVLTSNRSACCDAMDFQWKARIRTSVECCFAFYFYFKALVVISFDTFKYHYAHRIARYNYRFKGKMNKICVYYNWIETVMLHGKEHPSIELLSSHFTQVKWNALSIHSRFQWNQHSTFALKCKYCYLPCLNWFPHSAFISNTVGFFLLFSRIWFTTQ